MDIDKTITELELKRLLDSLSSSDYVEEWTDEHRKEFIGFVNKLGVEELEFNVVNSITQKEMEHHYRVFFNWGFTIGTKNFKNNPKHWIKVYSRRGMYFPNDSNLSIIWRPEIDDADDENKFYWNYWMFFNELKYAINESFNPVSGLRGAFPKKSIHQVLQTPFMILVKKLSGIED